MNYRHAFHAGNFADVHKHAVLARILVHLRAKPAAFRMIDSHAGAGRYDLFGPEALRGDEWRGEIGRLWPAPQAAAAAGQGAARGLLVPYLDAVAAQNPDGVLRVYPGSALIGRHLLRAKDRLLACELEPGSAAALQAALRGERRAKALMIDGWTALGAFVPPKERRGIVLIDPPFEHPDEFARLAEALSAAHRKWPTGIYLLWYPIKQRQAPDALARQLQGLAIPRVLRCELLRRGSGTGLGGSGLIAVNPPFPLEADLHILLPALALLLSPQATYRIDWLVGENPAPPVPNKSSPGGAHFSAS